MSPITATRSPLHSLFLGLTAAATIWVSAAGSPAGAAVLRGAASPIKHVFVIVLENEDYNTTFGAATQAPYLARTLVARGVLLRQYFGTGHVSVGNYIAMISGQAATPQTQLASQVYDAFTVTGSTAAGQTIRTDCL